MKLIYINLCLEYTLIRFCFSGHYKVEILDKNINDYVPTVYGLGMHVETHDPDDKIVLSRVSKRVCSGYDTCS